jgi:cyclopropane fatty-acyl-phospholipid synthase-like methyltransferase
MNSLEAIAVVTNHPVAYASPDHLFPWGTARDNSRNARFNAKLYQLFGGLGRQLRVLDLGCSGGGFVRDCLNDGCLAVGLEGSDFSLRMSRAEWALLGGKFLFTADITKPFSVKALTADQSEELITFDVITSWDVLEHIAESNLEQLCENLRRNLSSNGICIFSISHSSDRQGGVELHQTIRPKEWWRTMFEKEGFVEHSSIESFFNCQFIRGKRQNAPHSFHIVLGKTETPAPTPPALLWKDKLLDAWYFSRIHHVANRLICGP